jgi:hypothetical protein
LADGHVSDADVREIISAARTRFGDLQVAELKLLLEGLVADSRGQTLAANFGEPPTTTKRAEIFAAQSSTTDDQANMATVDAEETPCVGEEGLLDNLSLSATFDAFKGPMALGDRNDNRGVRLGANWGYPVWDACGLGVQLGTAATFADFDGRQLTSEDERFQSFTTAGLFQRRDGFHWAIAHDFLLDDYGLRFNLHQWRGQVGCEITPHDEIGIWAATGDNGDRDDLDLLGPGGAPVTVEEHRDPLTQGNLYWRHIGCHDTATRVWVGAAEDHGCVVGGDVRAPLGDTIALVAEANYLSDEIWNLSVGIVIYPRHSARQANFNRYAPVLPVANNGTFAVDRP